MKKFVPIMHFITNMSTT